jgi:hypothetical protein
MSSGGWARTSLAMDYPSPQRGRANLSRDGSNLRSRRRGDPRSEYSGPSANNRICRGSGSGATRVHANTHQLMSGAAKMRSEGTSSRFDQVAAREQVSSVCSWNRPARDWVRPLV